MVDKKNLEEIGLKLAPRISKSINKIRKVQPNVRIKSDSSEWLLSEAIRTSKLGPSGWVQGNRNIKSDMWLTSNGKNLSVSHKSGVINLKKNTLQFSGYRLGRFGSFDDQIKAISRLNADLFIYIAGKQKATADDPYYLVLFPGSSLTYGTADDWQKGDPISKYNSDNLNALINKSMSHQLWTTFNLEDNSFVVEL